MRAVDKLMQALPMNGDCIGVHKLVQLTGLEQPYITAKVKTLIGLGLVGKRTKGCYYLTPDGIAKKEAGDQTVAMRGRNASEATLADRLWAAIRAEAKFDREQLMHLAVNESDRSPLKYTASYLARLERFGVIERMPKLPNVAKRWRLANDLGPLTPTWRQPMGVMWDWNANKPLRDVRPKDRRAS